MNDEELDQAFWDRQLQNDENGVPVPELYVFEDEADFVPLEQILLEDPEEEQRRLQEKAEEAAWLAFQSRREAEALEQEMWDEALVRQQEEEELARQLAEAEEARWRMETDTWT